MKYLFFLLTTIALGCNKQQPKQTEKITDTDTTPVSHTIEKADNSRFYTTEDTVFISFPNRDKISYGKEEFNKIVDNHPEFFDDYPSEPEYSYSCLNNDSEFTSEAGEDGYCVLYAYFLRQRNGIDKYNVQRERIIAIYENINALFGTLKKGGTYFGHQYSRLLAHAEYSIYRLSGVAGMNERIYDVKKQKDLYIQLLRQFINDEVESDGETPPSEKPKRNKELNKIIDTLSQLITDSFYLQRAQQFHYSHYDYYY